MLLLKELYQKIRFISYLFTVYKPVFYINNLTEGKQTEYME